MAIRFEKLSCLLAIACLAALGFKLLSFAQGQGVKPVGHVTVVDSRGKTVGAALGGVGLITVASARGTQIHPTVLLRVGDRLAAVNIDRQGFFGGTLFFQSTDCSGTAWFPTPPLGGRPSLLPQTSVGPPGQTLYMEAAGAIPQTVTLNSRVGEGFSCTATFFSPITVSAVTAQPLVNLETEFTPPLSLRAAP